MPAKIDGKRKEHYLMDPDKIQIVGLDTDDGEEHPLYDQRVLLPVDQNLVLNIMVHGVIQPITVKKDGDIPQVVVGRQRVRAAREANKRLTKEGKVPLRVACILRPGTDQDSFGIMISENEVRRDDTPMVKAKKAQKYINMGADEAQVAAAFGVSKKAVQNWLRLLDCDSKVQKAVESGKIAASVAMKLAGLPRKEQVEQLQAMIEAGNATTKQAAAIARSKSNGSSKPAASEGEDQDDGVLVAPSKRTMNKILQMVEEGKLDIDPSAVKMLRWVTGEIGPQSIKGLKAGINAIEAEAEAKRKAKAEREAAKRAAKREAEGKKKAPPRSEAQA